MTIPNRYSPQTNVQSPRCPHCATEMPEVGTYQWTKQIAAGVMLMLAVVCPNAECRKVLSTTMMLVPGAAEERSSLLT